MKLGLLRAGYKSGTGGFSCVPIFAAFSLGPQPSGTPVTSPRPQRPIVVIKSRRARKTGSGVILRSGICHLGWMIIAAMNPPHSMGGTLNLQEFATGSSLAEHEADFAEGQGKMTAH